MVGQLGFSSSCPQSKRGFSLYNELFENGESDGHRVSSGLPTDLQQTNMSFQDNETGDLVCSPCEAPFGCSHAVCECANTERAPSTVETGYSTVNKRRGKIKYELVRQPKTILAPLRKTKGSSEWKTTKSASLVKKKVSKQKDHESFTVNVEWICDSGAGSVVWSDRALQEHGIPVKKWMRMRTKAKRPMCFESNLFGRREAYYLKDAPWCVPQGMIVEEQFMPYVNIPGLLPFHVTDCSKLKVTCPEKYRK